MKEIRCANCQQDHQAYARTCAVYQKEKEIIEVKHKRNVSFLEARRIVGSYMGESSYASVARRADSVAEPMSMSTPQMSYVNENSQSNMKEQRRDNNYNKRQFICRIYKRVCKCPWRLYVVFS